MNSYEYTGITHMYKRTDVEKSGRIDPLIIIFCPLFKSGDYNLVIMIVDDETFVRPILMIIIIIDNDNNCYCFIINNDGFDDDGNDSEKDANIAATFDYDVSYYYLQISCK